MSFRVLAVDDDQPMLDWLAVFPWESEGCELIGCCQNGAQALALARVNPPDILVTDIVMPVMDGLELTRALKSIRPDAQVVLLSSYREFDYARSALQLDVRDYLLKGVFDEAQLREVLVRCKERLHAWAAEAPRDWPGQPLARIACGLAKEPEHMDGSVRETQRHADTLFYAEDGGPGAQEIRLGALSLSECEEIRTELMTLRGGAWYAYVRGPLKSLLAARCAAPAAVRALIGGWVASARLTYGLGETDAYDQRIQRSQTLNAMIANMETFYCDMLEMPFASLQRDISRAVMYMQRHFASNLTLEQVAGIIGYSPNYFGSRFTRETGMTFREYLTKLRMTRAQELLQTTALKVYEVAERVGYPSYRYFVRVFKQHYGSFPTQVRREP